MDNAMPPLQTPDPLYGTPQQPQPLQPLQQTPVAPPKKSKKGLLIGVLAVILLAVATGAGWYYIQGQTQDDSAASTTSTPTPTVAPTKSGKVFYAEVDTTGMAYIYQHNLATQSAVEIAAFQYSQSEHTDEASFYASDSISTDDITFSTDGTTFLYTTFEGLYEFDIATQKTTAIITWKSDFSKSKYADFPDMPDFVSSGLIYPYYTDDPNTIGFFVGMYEGGYYATFNRTTKQITALPDGESPYGPNNPLQGTVYEIGPAAETFTKLRRDASMIVRTGNVYPMNFNDDASLMYGQSDDEFTANNDQIATGQYNLISINTTTGASEVLATYSDKSFSDLIVSGDTVIGTQLNGDTFCTLYILNRQQKSFDTKTCDDIDGIDATYIKRGDQYLVVGNGTNNTKDYQTWLVDPTDLSLIATFDTTAKRSFTLLTVRD